MEAQINRVGGGIEPLNLGTPETAKTLWLDNTTSKSIAVGSTETFSHSYTITQNDIDTFGGKGAILQVRVGTNGGVEKNSMEQLQINGRRIFYAQFMGSHDLFYNEWYVEFDKLKVGDVITGSTSVGNVGATAIVVTEYQWAYISYKA